jgi:hypothetical protein
MASFNGTRLFRNLNEEISKKMQAREKSFKNGDFGPKHYMDFRTFGTVEKLVKS